MRRSQRDLFFGATLCVVLVLGVSPLLAEDSSVFKNPGDIGRAQRILEETGYLASLAYPPGVLDPATQKALADYQSKHSLNATGTLDDDTYQMLLSHDAAYPWDTDQPVSVAAEEHTAPVEPLKTEAPSSGPWLAQAPPVPEPTPSTEQIKEAPGATPEPAVQKRRMPATGSSLPALALVGLVLLGAGVAVLRFRKA